MAFIIKIYGQRVKIDPHAQLHHLKQKAADKHEVGLVGHGTALAVEDVAVEVMQGAAQFGHLQGPAHVTIHELKHGISVEHKPLLEALMFRPVQHGAQLIDAQAAAPALVRDAKDVSRPVAILATESEVAVFDRLKGH